MRTQVGFDHEVIWDERCGCYMRSLTGGDDATDWTPVTDEQLVR